MVGGGPEQVQGAADLRSRVAGFGQVGREQDLVEVAVGGAVGPLAEVAIAKLVAKKRDHALLGHSLGFADGVHFRTSQCPPLAGPIRPMISSAFKRLMSLSTVLSVRFSLLASSGIVMP